MTRSPRWLKRSWSPDGVARTVRSLVSDLNLVTVCESSLCPNLRECYSQRQLTFMILGNRCTRSCRFCAVPSGGPEPADPSEPWRVAEAASRLGLTHIVITSVARDDLRDEGATHFVAVIDAVRRVNPGSSVEVLVPDFHARAELIRQVIEEGRPEVFAHNMETIERLSHLVRPQADYRRSLRTLASAAALGSGSLIKSSLMVGLGETQEEVGQTFEALLASGVTHLTIGQYLRPGSGPRHLPVAHYVTPEQFQAYEQLARRSGFAWVRSGPFVRSSYHAVDALKTMRETTQVR